MVKSLRMGKKLFKPVGKLGKKTLYRSRGSLFIFAGVSKTDLIKIANLTK